jgi:hypothetical protein
MISLDTRDFEADLLAFARKVELGPGIVTRKLVLDIFGDLLASTPVDTGRARSNWKVSVGAPDFTQLESLGDGPGAESIQFLSAQARLYRYRANRPVYITNGLPYIERLNEGWSQQAPAGFVEAAILRNVRPIIAASDFLSGGV